MKTLFPSELLQQYHLAHGQGLFSRLFGRPPVFNEGAQKLALQALCNALYTALETLVAELQAGHKPGTRIELFEVSLKYVAIEDMAPLLSHVKSSKARAIACDALTCFAASVGHNQVQLKGGRVFREAGHLLLQLDPNAKRQLEQCAMGPVDRTQAFPRKGTRP